MAYFNYRNLYPTEFEALAKDVMERLLGCRLFRYGQGKDGGIDLCDDLIKKHIVVQCKKYQQGSFDNLYSVLKREEKPKLDRLDPRPERYYVFTSLELLPQQKQKILDLFQEYMEGESCIVDGIAINDFFRDEQNHDLISRNIKLFLSFPENYKYSLADLSQVEANRLYDWLFRIFENDRKKSIKEILKGLLFGNTKKLVILFVIIITGACSICVMLTERRNDRVAKKQAAWLRNLFISSSEGDGWGDSSGGRTSYSIEEINANKLGPGITFNSVSDGRIGNEKNFVAAKVAGNNEERWEADAISVEDGQTYTLCLYVNNDNPNGTDAIANDVKTVFSLPTSVSEEHFVIGYIDASNSIISRYWDTVALVSDEPFYLEYVKNSAKLTNYKNGEVPVDDEIITSSGVSLGYNSMDGSIPGGYNYSSILTIDVIAHKSVTAKIAVKVRIKGTKEWKELINAKVGDEVEYQIEFVNLLSKTVQDIMIRDILPNNVEYVEDSTYLYNASHQDGVLLRGDSITTVGINIGDYKTQSNAYVRFTGRIVDKSLAEGTNQLVNWANVTNWEDDEKYYLYKDDASVVVNK